MDIAIMQTYVDEILRTNGVENNLVVLEPATFTITGAIGLTTEPLNLDLIIFKIAGRLAVGKIYVNLSYLASFPDPEIRFILAHECAHILRNHLILRTAWVVVEQGLKGEKNENYQIVELIKLLYGIFSKERLPPNATTLKEQEYEADAVAVSITGDLKSGISSLTRLSGGDLKNPSHTWELLGMPIPAMTLEHRIAELRKRYADALFPKTF